MVKIQHIVPTAPNAPDIASIPVISSIIVAGLRAIGLDGLEINCDHPKLATTLRGKSFDFVVLRREPWTTEETFALACRTAQYTVCSKNGQVFVIQ